MKNSKIKRPAIVLLLAAFVSSSNNSWNKNIRNKTTHARPHQDENSVAEQRVHTGDESTTSIDSAAADWQNTNTTDK